MKDQSNFLKIIVGILIIACIHGVDCQIDVEDHLKLGNKLFSDGIYAGAVGEYDKALENDTDNYLIYHQRALANIGLGKTRTAIQDLNTALALSPDFIPARFYRAKSYLRQGRLDEAKEDVHIGLEQKPDDTELLKLIDTISEVHDVIDSAIMFYGMGFCAEALKNLNRAIIVAPLRLSLREMRANCSTKMGDKEQAIEDLRIIVPLSHDDSSALLQLSRLLFETGNANQSLQEIRRCLILDPDHKDCYQHYKIVKKLVKLLEQIELALKRNRFEDFIAMSKKIANYPNYTNIIFKFASAYYQNPANLHIICDLAEAHMADKDYDSASKYFQEVLNSNKDFARAKEGEQKVANNAKKRNPGSRFCLPNLSDNEDGCRQKSK